ncbi:MAG: SigB/SigF/SigG family RNA polymerase sigma factor [Lachnospiraceae bacterium]|jgi:RNA polymerase sporulation-specific sigma factor|nr:SigB/SigF/SigG family RNA polymerase sigma factor [Lachnospiraceae bacterium]
MEHTEELIRRSQEGDKEAREILIEENMGLIHHVVKRFLGRGVEAEDLFQIGAIGLVKAVDRFDLSFGVRFSTYAVPMIAGEIKRFLRDDSMIKISRSLKELAIRAAKLREQLLMERGEEPGVEELSELLGVEPEELVQAMDGSAEVESLQKIVYQGDGEGLSLMDKVEQGKDEEETLLRQLLLEQLLRSLEPKERRLIMLRFFHDRTQTQVAEELGMSQVQVSRLEKKILTALKKRIQV